MDGVTVDLLALGAHADDAEIGAGATLAAEVARGLRVGIIDLTRGERATNGTPGERQAEAQAAAAVLGVTFRETWELPDGDLAAAANASVLIAQAIRRHRPRVLLAPFAGDRHPDHAALGRLAVEGRFLASLAGAPVAGTPHGVDSLVHYFVNDWRMPRLLVAAGETYALKERALDCHRSQFRVEGRRPSRLNSGFREAVRGRDAGFGSLLGVRFAEGFHLDRPPQVASLPGV